MTYDYLIIGGGIVGISTAWQLLQRFPNQRILVLEKEPHFAGHQTGHNSGVIHAGVYYQPDSLKADFCPQVKLSDLTPYPAGVRAIAVRLRKFVTVYGDMNS